MYVREKLINEKRLIERSVNYDRNTIRPMRALPGTTRAMP